MKISDLKQWSVIIGNDTYIIIGISSICTLEVFNFNTWDEETIEGDYLDKGDISHYDFTLKGDFDEYIHYAKMSDEYKDKLIKKVNELKEFYN